MTTRVELALATSLFDGVSTELADLLGDEPAAKAHLEALLSDGLISAVVEAGKTVYRWPPAARRAMLAELGERSSDQLRHLQSRLARLYAARNRPDAALRHALNAEDWPLVVQVIEQHWRWLLVSDLDILFAALSTAPIKLIEASPRRPGRARPAAPGARQPAFVDHSRPAL